MEFRKSLQAISRTLEEIEIKATINNLEKMLACQQLIEEMIVEDEKNGNIDSE